MPATTLPITALAKRPLGKPGSRGIGVVYVDGQPTIACCNTGAREYHLTQCIREARRRNAEGLIESHENAPNLLELTTKMLSQSRGSDPIAARPGGGWRAFIVTRSYSIWKDEKDGGQRCNFTCVAATKIQPAQARKNRGRLTIEPPRYRSAASYRRPKPHRRLGGRHVFGANTKALSCALERTSKYTKFAKLPDKNA